MRHLISLLLSICAAFVCVPSLSPVVRAEVEPLAVIMSVRSKVSGVTMAELNRVFRGQLTSNEDGNRFVPINQPAGSPHREAFDRAVLSMTPDQAQAFWIDQKIRGASPEPRVASSLGLALKLVSAFPGAITYVPASSVASDLKILRVDGKLPGESGYPLR